MSDLATDYYNRGNSLLGQRRYDEALVCYEAAAALRPDVAEVHNNLGAVLATLKQYDKACAHFQKALAAKPGFVNAHLALGKSLVAMNRATEAIPHLEKAIALKPSHIGARHDLGTVLNSLGRHDEAVIHFKRALKAAPDSAETHNNIGTALLALGRHSEALHHFRKAVSLKPGLALIHFNLGNALAGLGCDKEALPHYDAALALQLHYPQALWHRSNALSRLDRKAEAVAGYETAIAQVPGFAEAYNNLGSVLLALGRYEEAIARLEQALALDENCAEAHCNLGASLQATGRREEAMAHYSRALSLKPDFAEAHIGRGNLLQELGRIEEARQAFETAIEAAPRHTTAYHSLIDTKRFGPDDTHLAAMEALARDAASFSTKERGELHFALGKALADAGRYEASHHHFLKGNALKRSTFAYDEPATVEFLEHLRAKFTREVIDSQRGSGHPSPAPIFIVGMPRSGTTLVEQILAGHANVFAAGELRAVAESMKAIPGFEAALDSPTPGMDPALLHELGDRYAARIAALAPGAAHVTDKMPANYRFLGLIHLALPNARIVHVRRNPVDTCLSCFTRLFTYDQRFCYDLGELGRYYRAYHDLMTHWQTVLPKATFIEVKYEDVVGDLEGQARRMLAHCGLDWDDSCLEFHRAQRPVRTASAAQVRQPLYRTSIGRWRAYGASLAPLLDALGPELADGA